MRAVLDLALKWLQAWVAALQFLTRLPIPLQVPFTEDVLGRSVSFYPIAGGSIGVLVAAGAVLLQHALPDFPAAVLLLLLWVFLTGALHLDGLMDTADGILSHRSKEQMLEIMKDSRVGAMGVIAGLFVILLKTALLVSWIGMPQSVSSLSLLALIPVWSRWFMTWAIIRWPYARPGSSLGGYFRSAGYRHGGIATAFAVLLSIIALSAAFTWPDMMLYTAGLLLLSGGAGWGIAAYFHRKLGGLTGDTYGALNELLEVLLLLIFVVLQYNHLL